MSGIVSGVGDALRRRVVSTAVRRGLAVALAAALVLVANPSAQAETPARARSAVQLPPEATSAFRLAEPPWGNAVAYNPYSPSGYIFNGFVLLELAYLSYRPAPDAYQRYFYPEMATGWKLTRSSITLHLRPHARWTNGARFTSKDVMTSLLVAGGDYNQVWAEISAVHAPGPTTVVIDLTADAVAKNVLTEIVQVPIVPASQYGALVPKDFERDLINYWHLYNVLNPTTASVGEASDSTSGKTLAAVAAKIPTFQPKRFIGDGPYTLSKATSSTALLKKSSAFWDAKVVRVPWVELQAMDTTVMFGALLGGQYDLEDSSEFLDPDVTKLRSSPGKKYVFVPSPTWQIGLLFHLADYPFGIKAVRQAFAYVLDRKKVAALTTGGSLLQNPPSTYPDGMPNIMNNRYLSKSRQAQLNAYAHSTAKATSLLEGAGFTKRAGTWLLPNGKPFTFTLYTMAANVRYGEEGLVVENALRQFGIKTQLQEIESPGFTTSQDQGAYAVSIAPVDTGSFNPLSYYDYTFATTLNWPITYNGKGTCAGCHPAIGIGPVATVPGLGKVDIGAALNHQLLTDPPGKWSDDVWDWARWVNEQLPIIPLDNTSVHEAYSTDRYTHWPPTSKLGLWGLIDDMQPLVFMQEGYLRPAR